MIYLLATIQVNPGAFEEFAEFLYKEYLPLAEKHGTKLVASWRTLIGTLDEVTDVWAFNSLADLEKYRQSRAQDPAWQEVYRKIRSYIAHETLKIVAPLPLSRM